MLDLKPLIEQVFVPRKGENVIILNDFPEDSLEIDNDYIQRRNFARQWHHDFLELSKKNKFKVQEIITYEPTKAANKPLPKKAVQSGKELDLHKVLNSLGKKDIVLAVTRYSATAFIKDLAEKKKFRAASMPGVTISMTGFMADYKKIAEKSKILAEKLTKANACEAEFSTGHKVYFDLRAYKAKTDDGNIKSPGTCCNLPAGEAFICPYEGFEKSLGKSMTRGQIPAFLGEEKVVFNIEENKIAEITGIGPEAEKIREFLDKDQARKYIAELGLGCNDKAEFCGMTIQDEKIEGMHFAYGFNGHFGGAITHEKFSSPENILHQDIVYSLESKAHIKSLSLINSRGRKEAIIKDGKYTSGIFQ